MTAFAFNARQVAPDQGIGDPLPPGWYIVAATKSELKPTKDGTGAMLAFEFTVLDGQHKGRKVFNNFNIQNANAKTVEIAYGQFSALCHATGVMDVQATEQLHNIPFKVKVKVREAEGNYPASNDIIAYKHINHDTSAGNPNAVAARPAGVPPVMGAPYGAPGAAVPPPAAPAYGAPPGLPQAPQFAQPGAPAGYGAPGAPAGYGAAAPHMPAQPWSGAAAPAAAPGYGAPPPYTPPPANTQYAPAPVQQPGPPQAAPAHYAPAPAAYTPPQAAMPPGAPQQAAPAPAYAGAPAGSGEVPPWAQMPPAQ